MALVRRVTDKGLGLVATRNFRKGDLVYTIHRTQLVHTVYDTLEAFAHACRTHDAKRLLEHSVPAESGRVFYFSHESNVAYENHSDTPNLTSMHWSWLDGDEPSLEKLALVDVEEGDELCVDYNVASGYDVRTDGPMRSFLALCDEFGVSKRPSSFANDALVNGER